MASSTYEQLVDAARDLDAAQQMSGPGTRDKVIAQINTAMLIDIAASLRVIAEAASAPGAVVDEDGTERVGALPDELGPVVDDEPLEVGDRVANVTYDPGTHPHGVIESIGTSEGEEFAVVTWDGSGETRTWLSHLRRVEPEYVEGTTTMAPTEPVGAFEALTKAQKKAAKKAKHDG